MAEFQDINEEISEIEAVVEQPPQALPDRRYSGKSIEDVIKMHSEAMSMVDRHSRELGDSRQEVIEVRKLADELIKSQLSTKPEKVEEIDFFENPQEAVRRAVESNPDLLQAKKFAIEARQEQSQQRLTQMHPDFRQVVVDEGFTAWKNASKIRQQLFKQAEAYDVDAADELLSTYKAISATKQRQVSESDSAARSKSISAASVDVGGSGDSTRKIFRRSDLIRLKMRDPTKYESMNDEIMAAYADDRVR